MTAQTSNQVLLTELVTSLIGSTSKNRRKDIQRWTDQASKVTKSLQYARPNQFDVETRLNGLVEKFHVLNRDDLAHGLDDSLRSLNRASTKWTPDILACLLHLSDQPALKAPAYEEREPDIADGAPNLTWNQILADDPLSDEDLWLDQSYSPISSDSEYESVTSEVKPTTPLAQQTTLVNHVSIDQYRIEPQNHLFKALKELQFWAPDANAQEAIDLSDLNVIREVILMLKCLPTSLFGTSQDGVVSFQDTFSLSGVSQPLLNSVMKDVAEIGTQLRRLHSYANKPTLDHSIQRFRAVISNRLYLFTKELNTLEQQYTTNPRQKVVSLTEAIHTLKRLTHPLAELEVIVSHLESQSSNPFIHLEALYDVTCMHQISGHDTLYRFFVKVFFECLEIYLRSIRQWMRDGELTTTDAFFFIGSIDEVLDDAFIWHDQFFIRKTPGGQILAPKFIHPAALRILNAGKSLVFLRKLGIKQPQNLIQHDLSLEELMKRSLDETIAQFGSTFSDIFENWVTLQYTSASELLRQALIEHYHLRSNLNALRQVYFASDGSSFQSLADPIFAALDSKSHSWNDQFVLTERLRDLFDGSNQVQADCIAVRTTPPNTSSGTLQALSTISIDYSLSWPLLNIIRKHTMSSYQKMFKLLLQIYRVKSLLRKTLFVRHGVSFSHLEISIRQDLTCFTDILQWHIINTVIKPSILLLDARLEKAKDIDEMTEVHEEALQSIMTQCLLTKSFAPIIHAILSILELGVRFVELRMQYATKLQTLSTQNVTAATENMANVTYRRHAKRRSSMKPYQARELDSDTDSESDNRDKVEIDYDADTEKPLKSRNDDGTHEGTYEQRLKKIKEEVNRLREFVVTGLKGIARTGGESAGGWEMLAELLDWQRRG